MPGEMGTGGSSPGGVSSFQPCLGPSSPMAEEKVGMCHVAEKHLMNITLDCATDAHSAIRCRIINNKSCPLQKGWKTRFAWADQPPCHVQPMPFTTVSLLTLRISARPSFPFLERNLTAQQALPCTDMCSGTKMKRQKSLKKNSTENVADL